jgi:hypothetical protein
MIVHCKECEKLQAKIELLEGSLDAYRIASRTSLPEKEGRLIVEKLDRIELLVKCGMSDMRRAILEQANDDPALALKR